MAGDPEKWIEALLDRYPQAQAELTLLRRCGSRLPDVLTGTCDPLELLFPEGDVTTASSLYQEAPAFKAMNLLLQKVVANAMRSLPAGKGVRVLEIGAGTGGTTSLVLPALPSDRTEYVFTDVSALFTTKAREKFRAFPFVRYERLDIERQPALQGFPQGRFDLIIAANVLHATRDLRQTVRHVEEILAPGGLLILLEGKAPRSWVDLIFGLTEGWWRFADADLRPRHPLLPPEGWRDLLGSLGFQETATFGLPGPDEDQLFPQSIIVSRAPVKKPCRPSSWQRLILADAGGVAQGLADELRASGQACALVFAGDNYENGGAGNFTIRPGRKEDYQQLLAERSLEGVQTIVDLRGLDLPPPELADEPGKISDISARACGKLLRLVQALARLESPRPPRLSVVTRGAVSAPGDALPPNPLQAVLWGMARVIALEHPEFQCTRLDLDTAKISTVQLLSDELIAPDGEDQIVLRDGCRSVARLKRRSLTPAVRDQLELPAGPFRLAPDANGILAQMKWHPAVRRPPAKGEVELKVRAAGLNFLDLLGALGVLPIVGNGAGQGATAIELSHVAERLAGQLPLPAQRSGERAGGGRESSRATKLVRADRLASTLALPSQGASSPRPSPPLRRGEGENSLGVVARGPNSMPVEMRALGIECCGEVVAVGEGVGQFRVGDAVMGLAPGSFGQFVSAQAELLVPKPAALTDEQAAAVPVNFLTAHYALHAVAKIAAGERILIHAAAGGTGAAAVLLAQRAGAEVFATASPGKWSFLRSLGVRRIMNSRTLDFAAEIEGGVDVVLNSLAGEFIPQSLSVLRPGGRFLEIGKRDVWDAARVAKAYGDIAYHRIDLLTISREQPSLIQTMLRLLAADFASGSLKPLPTKTFAAEEAVEAFRTMQQARHLGKIVISLAAAGKSERLEFRRDGTYLIVGGLGGLGLAVAEWMAGRGAGTLVLTARHAPNAATHQQLERIEQAGAKVVVKTGDISDLEQARELVRSIDDSLPPLRGVIQAAGLLADGALNQQTEERFAEVLGPKVQGAWNLHLLTQKHALDCFILFSSTASLVGWAGQANHAAANAFLDSLAEARRKSGLAGMSVNWGAWSDAGAATRGTIREQMQTKGINMMRPDAALDALERLIQQRAIQAGVAQIDWPKLLAQRPPSPYFEHFAPAAPAPAREGTFRQELERAAAAGRRPLLETHLRLQLARVLGLNPSGPIDAAQGFFNLGMDSLTSVEFRNYLQKSLGCSLPSTVAFDYPNLAALAEYLERKLGFAEQPKLPAGALRPVTTSADDLEKFSQDELAGMLARKLAAIK